MSMITQNQPKRFRIMVKTWLNLNNDLEYYIAELIEDLKAQRMFAPVFRDGIRLICDLRNGSVDLLERMFPFVPAYYQRKHGDQMQRLFDELAELRQLVTSSPAQPPSPKSLPMPAEDDTIVIDVQKARTDSAALIGNFINSMAACGVAAPKPEPAPKAMAGASVVFDAPDYDDDDVDIFG